MSSVFRTSEDGGKTFRRGALGVHTDWHGMWIDPNDPEHYILGDDGGIAVTYDRGGTYDFINTMPLGQFYAVSYSMEKPYKVCGGLQDNGSWCGPSRARNRIGITNNDWYNVGGGDGFYSAIDPDDPNIIYSESQGGNASRLNIAQNTRAIIMRGGGRDRNSIFEDSVIVARGDTTKPETPQITRALADIRSRAAADSARGYRFNWSAPFFLSPHSSSTVYMGGNRLLKSSDRGDHFYPISPDLSTKDSARIIMSTQAHRRHHARHDRRRDPWHDHDGGRVPDPPGHSLGRNRRRQRVAHHERRRDVDRSDHAVSRPAEENVGESRRAIPLRHGDGVRGVRQSPRE